MPSTGSVLLLVLLVIMAAFSVVSLLIVGQRMRQQVRTDLTNELDRSQVVFANAEADRLRELAKEDQLLADLPSLKALLTTNDDRTIADGAVEFWNTSGNDLFALTGPDFRVRAAFVRGLSTNDSFRSDVEHALRTADRPYLVSQDHLFHLAVAPVYFGSASAGTLLGYVISGDLIDTAYQSHLSKEAGTDVVFLSGGVALASSAALPTPSAVADLNGVRSPGTKALTIAGQRSLALSRDLSDEATQPLSLVSFKSLQAADFEIHDIGRLLLLTGACILMVGSLLMVFVARRLTRPLEELADRVRHFGVDQQAMPLPAQGTYEIRQLAHDFAAMQKRVELSNRARLESERLATIGSMANSVSHDLRHYLASIYANAEFLATPGITDDERAEFFEDIQTAVMGTTDMLESLLIFSRTGQTAMHQPERLEELARRAVDQIRAHPDAHNVAVLLLSQASRTHVSADGRQLERAFYNLLLNACQAAGQQSETPQVTVEILSSDLLVTARVTDNGKGIAANFRSVMFDPFVSEGKQNGTGLGLTLCRRIAEDHGGRVVLIESQPGETIFELTLPLLANEPAFEPVAYAERVQ